MLYKLPFELTVLDDNSIMARCPVVRATAVGLTRAEAIANLKTAIEDMIEEFGAAKVLEDVVVPQVEV